MSAVFKVKTNLIMSNIYARNAQREADIAKAKKKTAKNKKVYYELVETVVPTGIQQKLVKVPYPITADYVKSHASSVDYRANIDTSWNAPARGANIPDCVDVQKLLAVDTEHARSLAKHLQDTIKQVEQLKIKNNKEGENNVK